MTQFQLKLHSCRILLLISFNKSMSMSEGKVYNTSDLDPRTYKLVVDHMKRNGYVSRDRMHRQNYFEFNIRKQGFERLKSSIIDDIQKLAKIKYKEWCEEYQTFDPVYEDLPNREKFRWMSRAVFQMLEDGEQ